MTASFPPDETLTDTRARELGHELGLRGDEYDDIVATLGRVPTVSELGMYSVMWSEHCSYKSSKVHLATIDSTGPDILAGPGENAGVVDVGDGIAVAFKIESHNHPSFVEPYQGAATGVGGILRDIFTMGARPIAVMDALRFGDPTVDGIGPRSRAFQQHIVDGVVRGVGGYGNCVGVPNIGGETVFDDRYATNPLVNVLAIGVMPVDRLQLAAAERVDDVAILLGSATGRDGIGGASVLASQEFDEGLEAKRPNVQVGDPFREKSLIECCLDLYDRDLIAGIQDMGAAGIACSTSELASAASLGMDVDLDQVHLREPSMESWEILCSESQERMLALAHPDDVDEVVAIAEKWEVPAAVVGTVVAGDRLRLWRHGDMVADVPARSLADEGPTYDRPQRRPGWQDGYATVIAEDLPIPGIADDGDLESFVLGLLAAPELGSARWLTQQYDSFVRAGTVLGPGEGDAGVVRLPGSSRGIACAVDGNGRWCELDPAEGTRRVVAEAFRNVACVGARPIASTNCLNFGNPERPEIMWQLATAIRAMGEATRVLGIPVTGGNVSLYNESRMDDGADPASTHIWPTPVMGVLGVLDDAAMAVGSSFQDEGDIVFLLGDETRPGLAGSVVQQYLDLPLGGVLAPVDLALEARLALVLAEAARNGYLNSAHDISSGGLVANLAESATTGDIGVQIVPTERVHPSQLLFSESPSRVLVTVPSHHVRAMARLCVDADVALSDVGTVGGDRISIEGVLDLGLEDVRTAHMSAVPRAVDPTWDGSVAVV
ncbi:MAG TPA: phosphoribosylformylglycinamidine synthase subunit PurL [Nitriliruptoraceae bacterium]|nr:phosphoribosylformylglycinamidine synthase subunit PurL [Nitriliruptoraceae bacterium]